MRKIMVAVAVSASLATPAMALAAKAHHAYAQAPYNPGDEAHMNPARMQALKDCTAREQQYNQVSWGDIQIDIYRECMAEHHQAE